MVDEEGNICFLACLIIGAVVGAVVGFAAATYADHKDDGKVFNGSVVWETYVGATLLGTLLGLAAGAGAYYAAPVIGQFLASSISVGGSVMAESGVAAVGSGITITGAQILSAVGAISLFGLCVMMSKHNPVMKNKPPVSWTTNQEGIDAMIKCNNDSLKATKLLLREKYGYLPKNGAHTEFSAIKKWLDRIIRGLIP